MEGADDDDGMKTRKRRRRQYSVKRMVGEVELVEKMGLLEGILGEFPVRIRPEEGGRGGGGDRGLIGGRARVRNVLSLLFSFVLVKFFSNFISFSFYRVWRGRG